VTYLQFMLVGTSTQSDPCTMVVFTNRIIMPDAWYKRPIFLGLNGESVDGVNKNAP